MELIGIPHRLVVSDRALEQGQVEYKHRLDAEPRMLELGQAVSELRTLVKVA